MTFADALHALLDEGIRERVYEQSSVAVYRSGELVVCDGTHDRNAVYDVASVTKVVTAMLTLRRFSDPDAVRWECPSGSFTARDLLAHRSGLPAWCPFFAGAALGLRVSLSELIANPGLQEQARDFTAKCIRVIPPPQAPKPTYSDLNFLMLGFLGTGGPGHSLVEFAKSDVFDPLGLTSMQLGGMRLDAVSTGRGRPRRGNPVVAPVPTVEGAVEDEPRHEVRSSLINAFRRTLSQSLPELPYDPDALNRAVDDDNAAAMGGLTGHAGLWSNAADLAHLGDALRQCAEGTADVPLDQERASLMFTRAIGSRTYGLDTPSGDQPAIGSILGRGPKGAAGHLGFTGCSLWIDRDAELSIAFLSNAVAIERPNPRIRMFRPRVHDLIARGLLGAG